MTHDTRITEIQACIVDLEARRDYAAMSDNWFRVDVLNEDISVLTAELYDQDVAR